VYLALAYRDGSFLEMQRKAASIGGDVDTIGAMAGAIWGAANGVGGLPAEPLGRLEARARLVELADALYRRTMGG
jgi:ADP-ribosylglycohydrolase